MQKLPKECRFTGQTLACPLPGQWARDFLKSVQEGIGRAFFCAVVENEILILHEFIKRSQKTPKKDLETAQQRLKEVKNDRT